MKNCAFQYATGRGEIKEDTNLITREEADELWHKYVPIFKKDFEDGKEPEMVIWIDMEEDGDYHDTARGYHWHASDMTIEDGHMYQKELVA